jgi:tetratricopeptide (TPR) repeat protein
MSTRRRYVWMVSRVFMQQATRIAIAWSTASSLCRAGSLFLLLLNSLTLAAQQPHHSATSGEAESSKLSPGLQQAEELRRQGLFDQARGKVQEELKRNPASVEAYNMLGFIYIDEKDSSNAVEAFQHALKLAPGSAKTRNNLGNVYLSEQKPDLAENEFRTVLRSDPGNRDANYNLGLLLMSKGSPAEAIPHFERVRPATVSTQFNLIHAYLASNRTAEGLRLANELSAQNRNDIQVHFTLGTMLAAEKQYKPAESELEKADALRPGTFEILYNLGQTYLRAGENSKAEFVLNRALKLKPDLLRRCYTTSGIGPCDCPTARRSAGRAGRKLFHGRQGGQGHRNISETDRPRSIRTVIRVPWYLLPASRPIRRGKTIFSGRSQARSS